MVEQPNNPLHGITLKTILEELVERFGWDGLAERIPLHCFSNSPSVSSSLKVLRKTPWARGRVEALYLDVLHRRKQNKRRAQLRANRTESDST